jgi:protein-disulfide isomerase
VKLDVTQESVEHPRLAVPVSEKDHAQGPASAPLTLVEYGDYECPYCGNAYPVVKRLKEEMGDRLRFVFRNFPLNTIHAHAGVAAQAAEAAAAQGKFWEMHDLLYEHQKDLSDADMLRWALKLGMEPYRFESDLSSEIFARRVSEDFRGGVRSGVNGTPTFFINGVRYDGSYDYESLKAALEEAA